MDALMALLPLVVIGLVAFGLISWRNGRHRCRGCSAPMSERRVVTDRRRGGSTRKVWTCSDACEERDYERSVW